MNNKSGKNGDENSKNGWNDDVGAVGLFDDANFRIGIEQLEPFTACALLFATTHHRWFFIKGHTIGMVFTFVTVKDESLTNRSLTFGDVFVVWVAHALVRGTN
jgi:hypothetical protein